MDYGDLDEILQFTECQTRQCTFVTIVDDTELEPEESFNFILGRTPGLDSRITLDPTEGEIVITAHDGEKHQYHSTLMYDSDMSLFFLHHRGHCGRI